MKRKVIYALTVPSLLFSLTATANNIERALNGNFYQVVIDQGKSWADAKLDAESSEICSNTRGASPTKGHLATITSEMENVFVNNLRLATLAECEPDVDDEDSIIACSQVWLGGFQEPGATEPGEGWLWVNNDGPISGVNGGPTYSNWATDEPNNSGEEEFLTIGRYSDQDNGAGWNDEGGLERIGGYIVEYESSMEVIIGDDNCGVFNKVLDENYCTISSYLNECAENARNHGQFVRCVKQQAKYLFNSGKISKEDRKAIGNCAAKSNVGKR